MGRSTAQFGIKNAAEKENQGNELVVRGKEEQVWMGKSRSVAW